MLMILFVVYILAFLIFMPIIKVGKRFENEMQEIMDAHLKAQKHKEALNRKAGK